MKEVLDASYTLMVESRWTPEARRAWDELRMVERRLAVDFLLYDVDIRAEISRAGEAVLDALRRQSRTEVAGLFDSDWEFDQIELGAVDAPDISAFDELPMLPGADLVEFDQ